MDEFLLVLGREQEAGQELLGRQRGLVVDAHAVGDGAHGVYHFGVLVEAGDPLLTVIAPFHGLARVDAARIGLQAVQQNLDERGLAHAVGTDDSHLLIAGEGVAPVPQYYLVAEGLAYVFSFEYLGADVAGLHVKAHVLLRAGRVAAGLQVVEIIDAVFGFRAAGLRLAAHPFQLAAQQVAHASQLRLAVLHPLGALLYVVVVVAVVAVQGLALDFDDTVAHAVQGPAVVRHHQ